MKDMREAASHTEHVLSLVSIVHKNLQYQADWSDLRTHTSPSLPRPLISGVPIETIYVDPDANTIDLGSKYSPSSGRVKDANLDEVGIADGDDKDASKKIEREWVLPIDLREKWTIRQWAEVFDSIPAEPPGSRSPEDGADDEAGGVRLDSSESTSSSERGTSKRKKRLVMAIVSGDSTVVYYIVHDGIVKPRQN